MELRGKTIGHTAVSVSKTSSVTLKNLQNEPVKITEIWHFYRTVVTRTGKIKMDSEYLKSVSKMNLSKSNRKNNEQELEQLKGKSRF